MSTNSLSKEALEILSDNGYSLYQDNHILTLVPSRASAYGLIALMLFLILPGGFLLFIEPLVGLIILVVVIAFFNNPIYKRLSKKSLVVDSNSRLLKLGRESYQFKKISKLKFHSDFVAEYTSAFKHTSKEYEVTLQAVMNNHHIVELLSFKSDYGKPVEAVTEITDLILQTANKTINKN